MQEQPDCGFGNVISGGIAEENEFPQERGADFGQIIVLRRQKRKNGNLLLLKMIGDSDPVVAGDFVPQQPLGIALVVPMALALIVMRTRVRVMNEDGLTRIAVLRHALVDQSKRLVKPAFHRFRSVPVARRAKVVDESARRRRGRRRRTTFSREFKNDSQLKRFLLA